MVLARFSYLWAVISVACLSLVLFCFAQIWFSHSTNAGFWMFLPAMPFVLLYEWELLRQLVFHRARAIWIADGRLIFVPYGLPNSFRPFLYSVPLETIDCFSCEDNWNGGFFIKLKFVGVVTKKGKVIAIPAYLLAESRDVILARLNEALAASR